MINLRKIVTLIVICITSPMYSDELQTKLQLVDTYFEQMSSSQHYLVALSSGAVSINTVIYQATINNKGISEATITSNYPVQHTYTVRTLDSDKTVAILPKTNKIVSVLDSSDIIAVSDFFAGKSKFSEKLSYISTSVELVESSQPNTFSISYALNIEKLEEYGFLVSNSPSITLIYTFQNTGKLLSSITKITGQTDCNVTYTFYSTSSSSINSYLNALPSIATSQIDESLPFDEAYESELEASVQ